MSDGDQTPAAPESQGDVEETTSAVEESPSVTASPSASAKDKKSISKDKLYFI